MEGARDQGELTGAGQGKVAASLTVNGSAKIGIDFQRVPEPCDG